MANSENYKARFSCVLTKTQGEQLQSLLQNENCENLSQFVKKILWREFEMKKYIVEHRGQISEIIRQDLLRQGHSVSVEEIQSIKDECEGLGGLISTAYEWVAVMVKDNWHRSIEDPFNEFMTYGDMNIIKNIEIMNDAVGGNLIFDMIEDACQAAVAANIKQGGTNNG